VTSAAKAGLAIGLAIIAVLAGKVFDNENVPKETFEHQVSQRKAALEIVRERYKSSRAKLNSEVPSSGSWDVRCEGDDCTVFYNFQVMDAKGSAHDVTCLWDVNVGTRMATPQNSQTSYYWTQ
jgi:hypothetical protein